MADWKDSISDSVLDIRTEYGLTLLDRSKEGPAVDIIKLATFLATTLITAIVVGVNVMREALFSILASPFEGLGSFAGDLVSTVIGIPQGALETAATTSTVAITGLSEGLVQLAATVGLETELGLISGLVGGGGFGILTWPIGVATVLLALYIASLGVQEVIR